MENNCPQGFQDYDKTCPLIMVLVDFGLAGFNFVFKWFHSSAGIQYFNKQKKEISLVTLTYEKILLIPIPMIIMK
jgi:hypothetical protein